MVSGDGKNVATGGISSVASEDIASMTVLKGAAATALYGSRAANGVIVITTKSGKKGDGRNFSISYSGNVQARMVSFLPGNAELVRTGMERCTDIYRKWFLGASLGWINAGVWPDLE